MLCCVQSAGETSIGHGIAQLDHRKPVLRARASEDRACITFVAFLGALRVLCLVSVVCRAGSRRGSLASLSCGMLCRCPAFSTKQCALIAFIPSWFRLRAACCYGKPCDISYARQTFLILESILQSAQHLSLHVCRLLGIGGSPLAFAFSQPSNRPRHI